MSSFYECNDCHEHFTEPAKRKWTERVEYWGFVTMETFAEPCCPECGSEDYRACVGELEDE